MFVLVPVPPPPSASVFYFRGIWTERLRWQNQHPGLATFRRRAVVLPRRSLTMRKYKKDSLAAAAAAKRRRGTGSQFSALVVVSVFLAFFVPFVGVSSRSGSVPEGRWWRRAEACFTLAGVQQTRI